MKPVIVVVRVAEGTGDTAQAQTISNIIGTTDANGKYTGLKALLTAEAVTGVKPRILGVPGYDTRGSRHGTGLCLPETARLRLCQRTGAAKPCPMQ